jgi:DNA-binding NtrC family response regulator
VSKAPLRIVVVDDNRSSADALSRLLRRTGDDVEAFYDGAAAIERIQRDPPDVVLTDLKMEPVDGLAVLQSARSQHPPVETIVFTAYGAVDVAVRAMHLGARDFLTKPVTLEQVSSRLEQLRVDRDPQLISVNAPDESFVAHSPAARGLLATLERAADVPSPVWLGGELGSGRAFAARTLHQLGRRHGPFNVINPRSDTHWPETGTVLLPNVDLLRPAEQLDLNRRLQLLPRDVRVVATATDDGRQRVHSGELRPELYYQLAVVVVEVPPLRRRREDVVPLFQRAIEHYAGMYERTIPEMPPHFRRDLEAHAWPGNIRELRNLAERTVVLGVDGFNLLVQAERPKRAMPNLEQGLNLAEHLEEVEKAILVEALRICDGDRNAVGRLLSVERNTLRYKLNKYDLLDK